MIWNLQIFYLIFKHLLVNLNATVIRHHHVIKAYARHHQSGRDQLITVGIRMTVETMTYILAGQPLVLITQINLSRCSRFSNAREQGEHSSAEAGCLKHVSQV